MFLNGAIFLEKSKKLVAYFYGLYLENVKTQMYDILNIAVFNKNVNTAVQYNGTVRN